MKVDTKSDVAKNYSSGNGAFVDEKAFAPRTPQRSRTSDSNPMQQHPSTANGMYESPKDPSTRRSRSSSRSKKERETALREKARRRRRMQQGRETSSSPSVSSATNSRPSKTASLPEEGRLPRTTNNDMSPRSSLRKSRREGEQRRSRAAQSDVVDWPQGASESQEV